MQLACIHVLLCSRPCFFVAGPEAISASRAPHVRARGMTFCMDIARGMNDDVRMLSMRHGHVGARACRPLCARACRRGVVLMKDGVFGRQTKNETTAHLPLVSCAACRPRRTPASASAPARLTVADKFCNGWRGDTPLATLPPRETRPGQFVPVKNVQSCMRMPCVPHGPSQACRCARWASAQYHTKHGECKAIQSWEMGRRTNHPSSVRAESSPFA